MFTKDMLSRAAGRLVLVRHGLIARHGVDGKLVGRFKVRDVAYPFRMPAGFEGSVNRSHPASILPGIMASVNPPTRVGQAVVCDTNGNIRKVIAGDTALSSIYGIVCRAWPTQQPQASSDFAPATIGGPTAPPAGGGAIDILMSGLMMVYCGNGGSAAPVKGGTVYVWIAADATPHFQGTFETARTSGSTITLDSKSSWQGGVDANLIGEIGFNL